MEKVISIGKQNFASLRENHYFFVDKSHFIKDWWENGDEITVFPPVLDEVRFKNFLVFVNI